MKNIIIITNSVLVILACLNYKYLNIGFLSNYSIDEYAFHGSLLNMYEGLITLDIKKLFSFDFYSYGFCFFFLNLLAVIPFIASDNIEMSIYIPRIITSLFAVGSIWYIYKIAKLHVNVYSSILVSVIVLTMPGFWKNAMWFHPDWMMTFFIVLTIYFFQKDNWDFKKYFWWASIALGFSFATKVQAITFMPFVFVYVFFDNIKDKNFENFSKRIKLMFKFICLTLLLFIVANPYLLHPTGLKAFMSSFTKNMNSNATNHGSYIKTTIADKISNAIDLYYLNTFVFYGFILIAFYLIFILFKRESKKTIIPIVGIYFLVNIIYLFVMVNKDWQHYYLSIFTVVPLILIALILQFNKYKYAFMIALVSCQIGTHVLQYKKTLKVGYNPEKEMSVEMQKEVSDVLIKDLKSSVNAKSNIIISSYQPFDYISLGLNYKNINVLYEPISLDMFQLDSFLEKSMTKDRSKFKKIDFIVLSKGDVYFDKEKLKTKVNKEEYNKSLQIINNFNKNGDLGYEKFSENKYFYIWKRKV